MVVATAVGACVDTSGHPRGEAATARQATHVSASGQAEQAPVRLAFFDSRIFDEDLSRAMAKKPPEVIVDAPARFSLNEIPQRIDRWLYAVKDSGGTVVAKAEAPPKTRGLVSALIDVVVAIFARLDEIRLYSPAENYNATLLYGEDGKVGKVVFERR